MSAYELAEKRNAEWNGDPADYPRWEPSPELAAELAELESRDPDEVIWEDGSTLKEFLADLVYNEQKVYLKAMPKEVWVYRGTLPKCFGESEHGPYSIRCTYQDADRTTRWNGPEMTVSTEDGTLVISMTVLGRTSRQLIRVRVSPSGRFNQGEERTEHPGCLSGKTNN